jgi:hypothetical protein
MANPPAPAAPKPPERPGASGSHLLTDSYILAQINESLKSDRLFHAMITDKAQFTQFLANIGKIPFTERGSIAKNITAIVDLNPRLLQDNTIFNSVIQIMKNIPEKTPEFQELAGKIMLKLREALIKNRGALNLYHKPMADYSETIRAFLTLIPAKPKGNFLSSFDQTILDFIMGKASQEQQAQKTAEREERIAQLSPFADDEEDEEQVANKMQRLIKMMFADVMRLEPELVSAVILSLVTQLPHGSMIIEDKKMRQDLMQRLDIV